MDSTHKPDLPLLIIAGILLVIGLIMITSIGVPKSIQISAPTILYPSCDNAQVDCYLLFKRHLVRMFLGVIVMFAAMKISFRFWEKTATWIFGISFVSLLVVLIFGSKFNTFAKSWIMIFNTSFQPTEFAKVALVIYLAYWFEQRRSEVKTFHYGFLPFCTITGFLLLPVLLQPDLGGAFVMGSVAAAVYLAAGARLKHIGIGILGVIVASMFILMASTHVRQRFQAFVAPSNECREDYCWQSEQALIAVGSGGFFGKGLAQGVQKSYWLPQASDDFIFAASAEELGFLRTTLLVLLYAMIGYRGYLISRNAPNGFTQLVAVGLTAWITFQAFVNIAVNISLFPITGITLPLVSYGGSSLIATMLGIGILLHISQYGAHASSFYRRRYSRAYPPQYRRH